MAESFDVRSDAMWDDLVSGRAPDLEGDVAAADAVRFVQPLSQTPIPGSARERARQRVFDSIAPSQENDMTALTLPASLPVSNGHKPQFLKPPMPIRSAPTASRRQFWLSLAAVIALLLAGMTGWFAFDRYSGNNDHPAIIPAVQDATPTPSATGWPQFRGGAEHLGYTADSGPGGNLDLRWTFTIPEVAANVVSDSTSVYVYGRKGDLYAVDHATGAQRWGADLSAGEYSDENRWPIPAVQDGVVYAGTYEGNIVALDAANGSLIWQRALSTEPIVASLTVVDDALYVVTPQGTIAALDTATGETRWEWKSGVGLTGWPVAAGGGLLYVANFDYDLVAIDATTGETAWTAELGDAYRIPAYRDGTVYIGGEKGSLYALDAIDGSVLWTSEPFTDAGAFLFPIVTPELVIISWFNGPLMALDPKTGQEVWRVDDAAPVMSPHGSATAVYIAAGDPKQLVAYDLSTGKELGRAGAGGLGGAAAISGETIVTGSNDDSGVIRSFGPGEGDVIENIAGATTAIALASPVATEVASSPVGTFDSSQVQLVWESTGSETAPLQGPTGMNLAPDGNLYVCDEAASVIRVFAPDGTYLETWGEPGSGPGQFNSPGDIDFDADGNIYVFDTLNNRVQKFAPDHSFIMEWGSPGTGNGEFNEIHGAVDANAGLVYVAEFLNNRVQVFDLEGNFLDKWGSLGRRDGQFYHPSGISIDAMGNVWVGEDSTGTDARVQVFDPDGIWLATFGTEDLTSSWGTAFDTGGNVYVGDVGNHRIVVFDPELNMIGSIESVDGVSPFGQLYGAIIDAGGFLYVADLDNGRILKLQLPTTA